ncbi:bifunctional [glutamate--ammonia ligase]-adenylyl-L-tyrosine phosphorylase/[glutamate--ammonia-ligase] adenylyltransferase [Limnohabitans sp. WS1]|uniref:bifunctional [glutamate--ammonia ligase]-adenylyl-L-tyrosine phosphorylase/[glutamate--ammonia-ligase] adenylyltransferase n=1 Tax=Limnohabitans sp. WS1 TaxID=1100726 RepID=UPI000D3CAF5F|nr:bifunctional [glutamate--ammonia ligase]-adenylyl-L-tyrosine phosphorylase/[glutamate--ammonia-ligase] adenylyltransferase [Limnohabitans sp. WS1]PUE18285.1 bifunctional glutamine synthetase adenylyltransferase/deadenyltransferase [Limnohabitans sp. WS1]
MTRSQPPEVATATGPDNTLDGALYSRFVQRLHRRYADVLTLLPPGVPTRDNLNTAFAALQAKGLDTSAALRVLRQLCLERLAQLDCSQQTGLAGVTHSMTWLAEVTLDIAWQHVMTDLDALHGVPTKANGQRAEMWIIGMGKLGARELNVSSDIDLIYVYDEDGETTGNSEGRHKVSCQEYFSRAVKRMYALIGETTEHGFVFRVDLALRPNGNSGPSVVSLDALENYLLIQGREWERFAWMKSRVIAPRSAVVNGSAQALRAVVLPFVFRRYLDYNVFESLRTLHQQIRDHASKRSAGHPERANDVKLSRGGIREIEFTVQLLQVVRGGQFPELRTRPTLDALQRVAKAGLMPQATADALSAAYVFLRQVEHRIQYLDDQQTHILPTADADLAWIAQTLGHANTCEFLSALDAHREVVAQEFDILLGGDRECKGCNGKNGQREPAELDGIAGVFKGRIGERLAQWPGNPRVQALRDDARGRLMRLLQRTAQWLQDGRVSEEAVLRMVDWIEPLLRRESYLALMLERPSVHERLLRLLGAAKWPARYLLQHPGVIDELAGGNLFDSRFDAAEFEGELQARLTALQRTGEDDEESLLNLLRRAHHAEQFRTLARDVEGVLTVEQVADDLSALADAVLRVTARWCWSRLKNRHREQPAIAIIGYGKLGGKELGYGSDLDIVFVYDDEDERAQEIYAAYVRKMINWMTVKTAEGDIYEIDTALRPNGNSGLLVTRFEAYADYQQQRGSNTAWTWEHQAMTRARFVMGLPSLAPRFDAVRHAVISAPRDAASLKSEIVAMRERVRQGHPVKADFFDVKHSPGGMVDAEFAVQYLVLLHTAAHPELADNVGNIALLIRAEAVGLLPQGMGQAAANAYREMRRLQHRARLNEEPTQVEPATLHSECGAILAVWQAVMD